MLKGLVLTPPVVGRISIGKVVERNGKRLPEKDDEFTITSQVQTKDGWVKHPLDEALRKSAGGKLRSIPIRLLFDDPDLNLRASYCMFDRATGRPLCVGDGTSCKRSTASGMQSLPCPSPEACDLAAQGACKPYGRMNIRIEDDDELFHLPHHRLQQHPHVGDTAALLPCSLGRCARQSAAGVAAARQVHDTVSSSADLLRRSGDPFRDDLGWCD